MRVPFALHVRMAPLRILFQVFDIEVCHVVVVRIVRVAKNVLVARNATGKLPEHLLNFAVEVPNHGPLIVPRFVNITNDKGSQVTYRNSIVSVVPAIVVYMLRCIEKQRLPIWVFHFTGVLPHWNIGSQQLQALSPSWFVLFCRCRTAGHQLFKCSVDAYCVCIFCQPFTEQNMLRLAMFLTVLDNMCHAQHCRLTVDVFIRLLQLRQFRVSACFVSPPSIQLQELFPMQNRCRLRFRSWLHW